ncbi:MAG: D-aminoacyl-tRNA deacylase [Salibacteraceae bacterium]
MRIVVQRVSDASVSIEGEVKSSIGQGVLVLLGIETEDTIEDVDWLCGKIARMRIFNDAEGKMNLSLTDVGGKALVISQFTLHASTKKGNRPSYIRAARPAQAIPLYETFLTRLSQTIQQEVGAGEFGANMQVALTNDGPVTITIDSRNRE